MGQVFLNIDDVFESWLAKSPNARKIIKFYFCRLPFSKEGVACWFSKWPNRLAHERSSIPRSSFAIFDDGLPFLPSKLSSMRAVLQFYVCRVPFFTTVSHCGLRRRPAHESSLFFKCFSNSRLSACHFLTGPCIA